MNLTQLMTVMLLPQIPDPGVPFLPPSSVEPAASLSPLAHKFPASIPGLCRALLGQGDLSAETS